MCRRQAENYQLRDFAGLAARPSRKECGYNGQAPAEWGESSKNPPGACHRTEGAADTPHPRLFFSEQAAKRAGSVLL